MNEIMCPQCFDGVLMFDGKHSMVCQFCGYTWELGDIDLDAINEMVSRERDEIASAIFNAAYYMNLTKQHDVRVSYKVGVSFNPLDLILFDMVSIRQMESGELDQDV